MMLLSLLIVELMGVAAWHPAAAQAVQEFADEHVKAGMKVLDVGGRDVNGCARPIMEAKGAKYTCQDMEEDPSVDVVSPPGDPLPFADGSFDVVMTSSVFEHDPMFWVTIRELSRVTKMGGKIFSSAPGAGPYHAWPGDNWRFYTDAPAALAFWCGKKVEGKNYPMKLVSQKFMGDVFNMNVMVWKRVDTPVNTFTIGEAMHAPTTHGGGGGQQALVFEPNATRTPKVNSLSYPWGPSTA
jgi:SAM-dependent methyltransferase